MMILERMLKEEWRTQSKLYRGRYLAALPFLIFFITYAGSRLITSFSPDPVADLGLLIMAFGFFTGLAAGSIGFNSTDAAKNVLGDANFLIFSSRTLPVSMTSLIAAFLAKDLIFYVVLYLLPVALAVNMAIQGMVTYSIMMGLLFLLGLFFSLILASSAVRLPSRESFLNYYNLSLSPLSRKTILDVSRSSGGLFKILASMFVLLGLYWYVVNYVPLASYLLTNPLLSFSVVLGMMSVTAYNWLNTYDEEEDYGYLPVDRRNLLSAKFNAFKVISGILILPFIVITYYLFGGNILLAVLLAYVTAYYVGAITMYEAGLNPNERMIEAWTFTKFLVAVNFFVIPLLAFTSIESSYSILLAIMAPMLIVAIIIERLTK